MKLLILLLLAITFDAFLCEDEELIRQKRVAIEGTNMQSGNADTINGVKRDFPITMPYENSNFTGTIPPNWGSCLMYLEGVTVVGINHEDDKGYQRAAFAYINGNGSSWMFDKDNSVNCYTNVSNTTGKASPAYVEFRITLALPNGGVQATYNKEVGYTVNKLDFTIHFNVQNLAYWYLDYATLNDIQITKGTFLQDIDIDKDFDNKKANNTQSLNIHGMYGYSYGCSATPAFFFPTNDKKGAIGIQLNNFQVEAYNIYKNTDASKGKVGIQFKPTVNDCVPTFSVGSWMSIIASLVLAAVFMFGFLMLNSVQSQDRFDDPKAKQIIINTKE